jgi:hypothetical protein
MAILSFKERGGKRSNPPIERLGVESERSFAEADGRNQASLRKFTEAGLSDLELCADLFQSQEHLTAPFIGHGGTKKSRSILP